MTVIVIFFERRLIVRNMSHESKRANADKQLENILSAENFVIEELDDE